MTYETTSAIFGEFFLVEITYADEATTLHGPFETPELAEQWAYGRLEQDPEDSVSSKILLVNKVR